MKKHRLTATLYRKVKTYPGFKSEIDKEVDEEFSSIYNARIRKSELEYLGYINIELTDMNKVNRCT